MSHPYYEGCSRGMSARRAYESSPERSQDEPQEGDDDDPYVTPLAYSPRLFNAQLHENEPPARGHAVHWSYPVRSRDSAYDARRGADFARPMSVPPLHSFYPPQNPPGGFPPHLQAPFVPAFPAVFPSNEPPHYPLPHRPMNTLRGGPPGYAPPINGMWSVPMYVSQRDLPRVNTPPHTDPLRTREPPRTVPTDILWPVEDWPPKERQSLELILYQLLLTSSGYPLMKWNMKEFPEELHRWSVRGVHVPVTKDQMSAPISHPSVNQMRITIKESPFAPIVISKTEALTLRDVLDGIFYHLHTIISPDRYDMVDPLKRSRVKRAYYRRCEEGHLGLPEYERRRGVKLIDWFEGKSVFGGLKDAYVTLTGEICCTMNVLA